MSVSDWIQLGILATYTLTLMGGGLIALMRLSHIIVDIEERQQRIDIAADKWKEFYHEGEKRLRDMTWQNHFVLTGLALIISILLLVQRGHKHE